MLHERLAQLARGFHPVRLRWQEHAAGAHAIHRWIVHAWWSDAVLHVRLDRGDEPAADANHHGVRRAEMLLGAIVDGAHTRGHRRVLHADAHDAGVAVEAGISALRLTIELVIVFGLLDGPPAAVPVGGIRLHRLDEKRV